MNAERIQYWISKGARPSDTVHNILIDTKVITGKKVNAMNKKTKVVKEIPKEEAKAPVAETPKEEAPAGEATPETPASTPESAGEAKEEKPAE